MNTDLTQYDIKPQAMINYLRYNGPHFNKKLLNFATSKMTKRSLGNNTVPVTPYTKEQVDSILSRYNIQLKNNQLYDYVYVAAMCLADFYASSIMNEEQMAKYIRDVIDDVDGYDGIVFNRWYADMCKKGIVIDWDEML